MVRREQGRGVRSRRARWTRVVAVVIAVALLLPLLLGTVGVLSDSING